MPASPACTDSRSASRRREERQGASQIGTHARRRDDRIETKQGDGKIPYVTNQIPDTVSRIDVGSQKVTKTIPVGTKPNGMVWRAR
jgi:YVTN family beta-propeller protein